jgi:hypothetical protein
LAVFASVLPLVGAVDATNRPSPEDIAPQARRPYRRCTTGEITDGAQTGAATPPSDLMTAVIMLDPSLPKLPSGIRRDHGICRRRL